MYMFLLKLVQTEMFSCSRGKLSELASHRGYDGSLCHGDVRLAFHHTCQPLQGTPREEVDILLSQQEKTEQMSPPTVDGLSYR